MRPEDTIDYHIKCSWHSIAKMYNQIASKYGMTQSVGYVLLIIDQNGTPATKIGPELGMEPTSLTRLLKSMEDDGLIFRKKDKKDGRVVMVYLTESGIEKRKVARKVVRKFNDLILDEIKKQDFKVFVDVIEKVHQAVEKYKDISIVS